ncbi:TPA: ImmA/IrrE family metallo-endopeptidase [Streptococcus agalactiae]|uniref:ImmA/IrrE family metallo-endopeptidase n=1 Tax=Streptococcus agalactiae TaxID=1311 RepID=UPI000763E1A4|nr:ImmA/IrrE family metallo-endopeptidase [Streptococcus agalactiae]
MKYTPLSREQYFDYHNKAYQIISSIDKMKENVSYQDVIKHFEQNYPILFNFLDYDEMKERYPELPDYHPTDKDIKYRGLVSNRTVTYTDRVLCESCAGLTVPDLDLGRYIIYINQHTNTKGRVIFTILHELSHIHCHLNQTENQPIYMSLMSKNASEKYPKELIPIEKEADTVASILYLTDERLKKALTTRESFEDIQRETDISKPALHNRLMNYLIYNLQYAESYPLKLVLNYRQGGGQIFNILRLQ